MGDWGGSKYAPGQQLTWRAIWPMQYKRAVSIAASCVSYLKTRDTLTKHRQLLSVYRCYSLNRNIVVSRWKSPCMLNSQELWQISGRCRKIRQCLADAVAC